MNNRKHESNAISIRSKNKHCNEKIMTPNQISSPGGSGGREPPLGHSEQLNMPPDMATDIVHEGVWGGMGGMGGYSSPHIISGTTYFFRGLDLNLYPL